MQRHNDNVGVLRLVFASLVIIGHAPEMIDGTRVREPLTRVFHTLSLGELSVDAFFLISGYLIADSWIRTRSLQHYLQRRVLRIYPAFMVSYLFCCLCLAPLVGGSPGQHMLGTVLRLAILQSPPNYPGELIGIPHANLNGSMWTIAYEFRCYLLVAALGMAGLLEQRRLVLAITGLGLAALVIATYDALRAPLDALGSHRSVLYTVGSPWSTIRLTTAFLAGTCFYLYRDWLFQYLNWASAFFLAVVGAAQLFHDPHFAEVSLIVFGGAALFWLAFKANIGPIQAINDEWDISYGVYLYGWPIATAIRYFNRGISPSALAALTLPLALICGTASWWGLEKWTKSLARSWSIRRPPLVSAESIEVNAAGQTAKPISI